MQYHVDIFLYILLSLLVIYISALQAFEANENDYVKSDGPHSEPESQEEVQNNNGTSTDDKVDEIIDKLLNSDKMRDLAGYIADKAAERLLELEKDQMLEEKHRASEDESLQVDSELQKNNSMATEQEYSSTKPFSAETKAYNKNPSHIARESGIHVDRKPINSASLEDVSLKFKHFTENFRTIESHKNQGHKNINYNIRTQEEMSNLEYNKKHRGVTSNGALAGSDISIGRSDEYPKNDARKTNLKNTVHSFRNDEHSSLISTEFDKNRNETTSHNTEEEQEDNIQIEYNNKNRQDVDSERNLKSSVRNKIENGNNSVYQSKEDHTKLIEVNKSGHQSENVIETNTNDKTNGNSKELESYNFEKSKESETTTEFDIKTGVRKEGDRYYTFQNSPDYAEYFEKLAKEKFA